MKLGGAIVLGGFALSCGGAPAAADSPGSDNNQSAPGSVAESAGNRLRPAYDDEAGRASEPPRADESASGPERVVPPESPDESNATFSVLLPRDEVFLKARLPEYRPSRYQNWRQQSRIRVGHSHLDYAAFLDGGRLIAAKSDSEGAVRIYDGRTKKLLGTHDLRTPQFKSPDIVGWPSDGSQLTARTSAYYSVFGKNGAQLFEAKTGAQVRSFDIGPTSEARFSDDGSVLITETGGASVPSTLHFHRRKGHTLRHIKSIPFDSRVDSFALSRDNRMLAVNFYRPQELRVIRLDTGVDAVNIPTQNFVNSVDFSPDGRWLALGGQGLLLVDLMTPTRRAYYSYFYNNINTVRFSPSGDAVAASSYDGRIRLFSYGGSGPSLDLIHTLRHDGRANVYRIEFSDDGNSLVSASGDQTVRVWSAPMTPTSRSPRHDKFLTLPEWAVVAPRAETLERHPLGFEMKQGHFYPDFLQGAPRPSRIREGIYSCKISTMYKMRPCTVKKRNGHFILEFKDGHLLDVAGVLHDDGQVVRYTAWLTKESTVVGCDGCEKQPLHGIFRGSGRHFQGLLTFRNYHDPFAAPAPPAADVKFEEADDRLPLTLIYKKPLPTPKQGHDSTDLPPIN